MSVILTISLVSCSKGEENDEVEMPVLSNKSVEEKLESMTLEEKINQMMVVSIPYTVENDITVDFTVVNEYVSDFLKENQPGGVILFQGNMIDYDQTKLLISDIQKNAIENKFIISVDEEGGIVHKIPNENNTPNAEEIGNTGDSNNAYETGKYIGGELKNLGFNIDFAPVADVNTNPQNPVIGERAFSNDPKIVSQFVNKFLDGLNSEGILGTVKHFPGHGDTDSDSHLGLVSVEHPKDRIYDIELYPFKEAIKNNVELVMVGHIIVPALDKSNMPGSLSKIMVTDILKKELGFEGVVTTDAMNMGAIADNYTALEATKLSINAGCDIILMPNVTINPGLDVSGYEKLIDDLVKAVENGEISEERINDAVLRILTMKENFK